MFKGFYNLTSAMLTHQQNLNVIGNNMTNVSTAGYKQSRYTATTFDDVLYHRMGNQDGKGTPIGRQSYIRAASDITVDHQEGVLEPTNRPLDMAIQGDGFFAVRGADGQIGYTRMGNFVLDEQGFLSLQGHGRVLGPSGNDVYLGTDKVRTEENGVIHYQDGGMLGQVGIYTFADLEALDLNERGLFTGDGAQAAQSPLVLGGYLERSNTDLVKQMTEMISVQRSFQSAAQISKMYDQLMTKAASEIGRM